MISKWLGWSKPSIMINPLSAVHKLVYSSARMDLDSVESPSRYIIIYED